MSGERYADIFRVQLCRSGRLQKVFATFLRSARAIQENIEASRISLLFPQRGEMSKDKPAVMACPCKYGIC